MLPALKDSQYVIAEKFSQLFFNFRIGDVAIIKLAGGKKIVKRITAKIGDNYFVEGDNKAYSADSRHFGFIPRSDILSRVILL
ncbi:MAG: S26 family signal peptidase [Candidatus Harrisonbacteria bacterium]|nr:S26 family signal peptidase [Candidatus Harrisonbacteria bacterium]